ncbi:peroxiredoxin [Pedomonas sp. V897]|uniref:peroxiredoxin n=1 Tax=Pedomonas sp. V897 TaxID=3446482 RepID=UPI003EE1D1BC
MTTIDAAAPETGAVEAGKAAPDFSLALDDGRTVSLADFRGKPLVLYFYPKDDTSGCTSEAKAFSELKPEFDALGVEIVGVSRDSIASHTRFRQKYDLTVHLGSDPDLETIRAYGVWVEKSMYGRKYMGIERATFLIDGAGVVHTVWRKVKVTGHAAAVLKAAKALASA